jgi:hypothetical protein
MYIFFCTVVEPETELDPVGTWSLSGTRLDCIPDPNLDPELK